MLLVLFVSGMFIQKIMNPLIDRDNELMIILGTFAIGALLENALLIFFGGRLKRIPTPLEGYVKIGEASISYHYILIFAVTLSIMIAITLFLKKTRIGMSMRAVAQNKDSAFLVGIPVKRVYMYVFGISTLLAGISGVFMGSTIFITPNFGQEALYRAFIICVIGGLGSIPGTILGAYLVGFLQSTLSSIFTMQFVPPILFVLVMLILLLRPQGLLGSRLK
jgi:branched-chain amino acid transport system permease protein